MTPGHLVQTLHALNAAGIDGAEPEALAALGNPERRLAVYGTLRRHRDAGEADNHGLVADLGEPRFGSVEGSRERPREAFGHAVFFWRPGAPAVAMEVYESARLTAQRWARYDGFENGGFPAPVYRRIFVPVVMDDATLVVATVYAGRR